jgi:succinate dehydrogenase/fumarate reductase flavoprotein subunit
VVAVCGAGVEADFSHSGTASTRAFGVNAAFMLQERHEPGIHAVRGYLAARPPGRPGSRAPGLPGPRPVPGLYAAGEVAGFGGGGMHGYRSLEGSFLGGCLFSGRQTGRAAAQEAAG